MTTEQRCEVRQHLIDAGFRRNRPSVRGFEDRKCEYDKRDKRTGLFRGDYVEYWQHPDGSQIRLKWARKTRTARETKFETPTKVDHSAGFAEYLHEESIIRGDYDNVD